MTDENSTKELDVSQYARDELAHTVIMRFRDAYTFKTSHVVFEGQTFIDLMDAADRQVTKTYSAEEKKALLEAFGLEGNPRYDSATLEKIEAATDWYHDVFTSGLDEVFTVRPTPVPELDDASIEQIRQGIRQELWSRMQAAGQADPMLLVMDNGRPSPQLADFLNQQVRVLHRVQLERVRALAMDAADEIQTLMRDRLIEGEFSSAYAKFVYDRFKYGRGVMRFPDWQRKRVLKHSGAKARPVFEVVPTFRAVKLVDFFPSPDAEYDLQKCLGVTERRLVSKIDLINLGAQKNYRSEEILALLDEYETIPRNWLPAGWDCLTPDAGVTYWQPDKQITLLIHEGYFTGDDLAEMGIKGLKSTDFVNAHVEICGRRTIRCELTKMPGGIERSYFSAPFTLVGDSFWDCVGLAGRLADTEKRANELSHMADKNAQWAANPPLLANRSVFADPDTATNLQWGQVYDVNDAYGVGGSMPEPLRAINGYSAQYHLLYSEAASMRKNADDASGIPSYAYTSANYGDAPLGEYAQRMSNALRVIKGAAWKEDIFFTKPAFTTMFRYLLETEPDLAVGQDLECDVSGMAGLLAESIKRSDTIQLIPIAMQGVQVGALQPNVLKVLFRQVMKDRGVPIDQISPDDDPLIENAWRTATNSTQRQTSPAQGNQVPQLDGRSDAVQQTVSAPNGASPQITGGA